VEEISERPQRPVVPPAPTSVYSNDFPVTDEDPWSNPGAYQAPSYQSQPQHPQQQQNQQERYDIANDDYDSDFDDDDYPSPQSNPNTRFSSSVQQMSSNLQPIQREDDTHSMASTAMNRKSSKIFSKSSDSYIMGNSTPAVSESDQVHIYLNERGFYYWMPNNNKYTVTVTSPKMESKFKGNQFQDVIKTSIGFMKDYLKSLSLFQFHHCLINKFLDVMKNNLLNIVELNFNVRR
jgi:hypothetical protein